MYITTPQGFWYAIIINAHTQMPFSIYNMHKAGGESRARERSYKGGGGRGGESIQLVGNMRERWREREVTWYERFCHGHPINIYIHERERERERAKSACSTRMGGAGGWWPLLCVCLLPSTNASYHRARAHIKRDRWCQAGALLCSSLFFLYWDWTMFKSSSSSWSMMAKFNNNNTTIWSNNIHFIQRHPLASRHRDRLPQFLSPDY